MWQIGAAVGLWLVVVVIVRVAFGVRPVRAAPAATALGGEPPAVVAMLTRRWTVPKRAAAATLLDLAARGHLTLESRDGQTFCSVNELPPPNDLLPYEQRVVALVRSRSLDGTVPLAALDSGSGREHKRWWTGLRNEVYQDAAGRGLSRRRYPGWVTPLLLLAALAPAAAVASLGRSWYWFVPPALVSWALTWVLLQGRSVATGTPAGREAAARWLGVRAGLLADPAVSTRPAAGADRLLAYGAALGVARTALAELALEPTSAAAAWSNYSGRWRRVEITHRGGPAWGVRPDVAALLSAWAALVMVGLIVAVPYFDLDDVVAEWHADLLGGARDLAGPAGVAGYFAAVIGYALFMAVFLLRRAACLPKALVDLRARREVTGLLIRRFRMRVPTGDGRLYHYYLAVDDGSSDRVRAFQVSNAVFCRAREREHVRLLVTPNLGFVHEFERLDRATAGSAPG